MKKLVLGILLFLVVVGATTFGIFWYYSDGNSTLHLYGTVEVQEVRLGSKIAGRVKEVLVRENDIVEPNQLLVRFETPELEIKRDQARQQLLEAELLQKKAQNGNRPQEIAEALAQVQSAEAQLLRLKNGFREEEKRKAKYDLELAQADLKLAEDEHQRVVRLRGTTAFVPSQLDSAIAARDRAHARVNAAQAQVDLMKAGSRVEDIAEAEAEVERARQHHALLQAGTRYEDLELASTRVQEARAALEAVEADLREAQVKAPGKCLVEVVGVRKGDVVPPNQPVIRVLRADDLWVKVFVPSTELGKVRLGQKVQVYSDAYPDRAFEGTVFHIASISEFTPRNVQSANERRHQVFAVKVRVDDSEGVFKSGMAAQVRLPLQEEP